MSTLKTNLPFFLLDTISGLSNPLINSTAICSTISSKYKFSNGEIKYSCPGTITDNDTEMEKGREVQNKNLTAVLNVCVLYCYFLLVTYRLWQDISLVINCWLTCDEAMCMDIRFLLSEKFYIQSSER